MTWSRPRKPSAIADTAIGGDRELSLLHCPPDLRDAFRALWELDAAMGDVVARSTEPTLAAIKLAWWRDQLEALDDANAPAEPRLQAVSTHLLIHGVEGTQLAMLADGWATLIEPEVDADRIAERGCLLFRIGGQLLGQQPAQLPDAGALWALASVGRRGVPELFQPAREYREKLVKTRFPRRLRSLTGLARLAARDMERGAEAEAEGSPRRAAAFLSHRWTGIVTRG